LSSTEFLFILFSIYECARKLKRRLYVYLHIFSGSFRYSIFIFKISCQFTDSLIYCITVDEIRPLCQHAADSDATSASTPQCPAAGDDAECRVSLLHRYAVRSRCNWILLLVVNTAKVHDTSRFFHKLLVSCDWMLKKTICSHHGNTLPNHALRLEVYNCGCTSRVKVVLLRLIWKIIFVYRYNSTR